MDSLDKDTLIAEAARGRLQREADYGETARAIAHETAMMPLRQRQVEQARLLAEQAEGERRKRQWLDQTFQRVVCPNPAVPVDEMEDFKANYYDMLHWDQQQELDGRIKQAQSARRRNQQWRNDQERARIEKEAAESRAYEVRASAHAEACRRLNEQETAKKVEHEEAKRLARRKLLWLY